MTLATKLPLENLSKREGYQLSRRTRIWACGVGLFSLTIFFGIFTDEKSFETPIYRVHRELMPMQVWGFLWAFGAFWAFLCVYTKSVRLWLLTAVVSMMYASWWAACTYISQILGESVTLVALAPWGFTIFAYGMGMMSPIQVERRSTQSDSRSG